MIFFGHDNLKKANLIDEYDARNAVYCHNPLHAYGVQP